ncbi:MAG TPA: hypothetical protein VK535_13105 [Gemmatimonadales bacterium]|nr:hypothetical protein [Gemmatimonadales bacterium]
MRARFALPIGLTLLLVAAGLTGVPALSDPVSGPAPPGLHLATPPEYLVLAPLFTLWDGASMLSMSRLRGLLIGLALVYLLWRSWRAFGPRRAHSLMRELGTLTLSLVLLLAFLITGAVWHRPMLALAGVEPGELVVDFHSHTNLSHDVQNTWMRGFDAEANRRWHQRAGFDAVFITDHNVVTSQEPGPHGPGVASRESGARPSWAESRESPILCPGIEVSAWRSHIVLLGDSLPVDRSRYNGSLDALLTLLRVSDSAYRALSVASLPEYRRNHWGRLDTLVAAGLDGFEIVNAAPKANEITRMDRNSVIEVARSRNRFVVGVSDSHGWGATSMVWNLVGVPGTQAGSDRCGAVLHRLRDGFGAVQVIERHRLRPDDWWPMWLTPVGLVWETWRSMGWPLTAAWIAWIWVLAGAGAMRRRRR